MLTRPELPWEPLLTVQSNTPDEIANLILGLNANAPTEDANATYSTSTSSTASSMPELMPGSWFPDPIAPSDSIEPDPMNEVD